MVMLNDFEFSRREIFKRNKGNILNRHETSQYFPSSSSLIQRDIKSSKKFFGMERLIYDYATFMLNNSSNHTMQAKKVDS